MTTQFVADRVIEMMAISLNSWRKVDITGETKWRGIFFGYPQFAAQIGGSSLSYEMTTQFVASRVIELMASGNSWHRERIFWRDDSGALVQTRSSTVEGPFR